MSGLYFELYISVANFALLISSSVFLLMGTIPSGQPFPFSQKLDGLNSAEDFWSLIPLGLEVDLTCTLISSILKLALLFFIKKKKKRLKS